MHKLDPKFGPDKQAKRSVIGIEAVDVEQWLMGSTGVAKAPLHARTWRFWMQGRFRLSSEAELTVTFA